MSDISQNRSGLKEFLASIATIPGDLSNITAPPFVLSPRSAVEFPAYWAEHPAIFVAPARESDPARRALLVLRWFLSALKQQQYGGRSEDEGVKKPLNAFLGEVFFAGWEGEGEGIGETRLVSEQVSHHPPVTACYLWNAKNGVRAEGYTAQSVTYSPPATIQITQTGHAILHLDSHTEDYLIPLPSVKVSGILSGTPQPALNRTYHIPSSNGYVSEIDFSPPSSASTARKLLPGRSKKDRDAFSARLYHSSSPKDALFTVEGSWTHEFTIHDVAADRDIETYDIQNPPAPAPAPAIRIAPVDEQTPWESRRAWQGVADALAKGDMKGVSEAKHRLEEGQRGMRRKEEEEGDKWKQAFFRVEERDERVERLLEVVGGGGGGGGSAGWGISGKEMERTDGVWRVERERVEGRSEEDLRKGDAGRGGLAPTG